MSGPIPPAGEAIIDADGLTANVATILILADDVVIENLTLQNGPGQGIRAGNATFPNLNGIIIRNNTIRGHDNAGILTANNASLSIENNTIIDNGLGTGFGRVGIYLYPHGETQILGNIINNNYSDGIFARGTSSGLLIEDNEIKDYNNSGITLAWDESNVTIRHNTITDCGAGIIKEQGGIVIIQSMAETITENTIQNCNPYGIFWEWVPTTGPAPAQILISENTIANSIKDGIFLFSQGPGGFNPPGPFPLEPDILNNQIIDNGQAGVHVSNLYSPGDANPIIHDNNISGNAQFGVFNGTAGLVDATDNWWGNSSGPFHPTENPPGTGDPVSDNVGFVPWQTEPFPVGIDCLSVEKIYDHCFATNTIVKKFPIPLGNGGPCANIDLTQVDGVICTITNAECQIIDIRPSVDDNLAVITIGQEVEMEIRLVDDALAPPAVLYSYTAHITDIFSQVQLYVPPQGLAIIPGENPYVSCELVNASCLCSLETPPPGEAPEAVFCTLSLCQIIESHAFSRLLITHYGYCIPGVCPTGQDGDGCPPIPPD